MKKASKYQAAFDAFKGNPLEAINEIAAKKTWSKAGINAVDDRVLWTIADDGFNVYAVEGKKDDA